jgi:magnesium transporter
MVDCGVYVDGVRLPGKFTHAAALNKVREIEAAGKNHAFVWSGLHGPDEPQMQAVADVFGLHELAVEDAVHAHQRPKLERYDDTLFLVLKTVKYVEHESVANAREIVETGEIMIFVGTDFVVTVRHGDHGGLAGVRKQMDTSPANCALGPYAVMHAIADHVVDSYLGVTDLVETDIDAMEENVFSPTSATDIEHIYLLKREIVEMRRAVSPLTFALQRLGSDHNDLISKEVRRYMRDVLDHTITAADRIASYDEVLSSLVQAAVGKVGMQQNTDMRKISAWVAIAAVPTALAGIYGMNFDNMPELHWTLGYPMVLLVMLTVCVVLHRTFRRNNWL